MDGRLVSALFKLGIQFSIGSDGQITVEKDDIDAKFPGTTGDYRAFLVRLSTLIGAVIVVKTNSMSSNIELGVE